MFYINEIFKSQKGMKNERQKGGHKISTSAGTLELHYCHQFLIDVNSCVY